MGMFTRKKRKKIGIKNEKGEIKTGENYIKNGGKRP